VSEDTIFPVLLTGLFTTNSFWTESVFVRDISRKELKEQNENN